MLAHDASLAARCRGVHFLIGPLLAGAVVALVVGWFLPIMTVSRFVFWEDKFSILDAIRNLWTEEYYFTFAVILLFTIVFPLLKLGTAFFLWLRVDPRHPRTVRWVGALSQLGKWSMLDVFVVALSIVAINVSLVSDVTVHAGLYVFCGAIIASMLMVLWIEILIRRLAEETLEAVAEGAPGE